mgnify:CR=1 FL=1
MVARGIHHLGVAVHDLDEALASYERLFDAELEHRAVVEGQALVGAGALVAGGMVVPSRAMALGVPAKIKPDSVDPHLQIEMGMQVYIERGRTYRAQLRRID